MSILPIRFPLWAETLRPRDFVISFEKRFHRSSLTLRHPSGQSDHATLEVRIHLSLDSMGDKKQGTHETSFKANLTGLRTFLGVIPELHGDVDDINSTITEAIHEADKLYVPRTSRRRLSSNKLPKRIRRQLDSRNQPLRKV